MNYVKVKCDYCGLDNCDILYKSNIGKKMATVREFTSTVNKYASYNNIVKCNNCGLIYMNPRDKNVNTLYRDVIDNNYLKSWNERKSTFRNHLVEIKRFKKRGRLLDIGCYAGIFPEVAKEAGFEVTGIEPSKWAAKYAKNKTGLTIYQGSWDKVKLRISSFDVVTIWDVIEHLEDPLGCLNKAYKWTNKGGILVVTTHDISSLIAKIMGGKYPWLMRFHLYHFDKKTLAKMIEKAGFKVVVKTTYAKIFSLKYLLSRIGVITKSKVFEKISLPIYSGDMMMIIAIKE